MDDREAKRPVNPRQITEPIFSPEELTRVERPPWWRALIRWGQRHPFLKQIRTSVPGQVGLLFLNDWGARDATLIAWACLVSVLPMLLAVPAVTVVILKVFGIEINASTERVLNELLPAGPLRDTVYEVLREVAKHTALLTVIAAVGLVWRGSALFRQLEICLSRIAGVRPRTYLRRLLLSTALVLLVLAWSLVTAASTVLFFGDKKFNFGEAHDVRVALAAYAGQAVIELVAGYAIFMFIYGVIPNHAYRLRQVWPGATLATAGFLLVGLLFPLYSKKENDFGSYGTNLALIVVLVVYFYLIGVITVLGAHLNAVLGSRLAEQGGMVRRARPAPRRRMWPWRQT